MIKTHLDQTAAIEEPVSWARSVCNSFCIVWRHLSTVSYIIGVRRCKSSMVNDEQNRTEQKIYLLSNIASVNISSEELVFRQTNVYM